MKEQPNYYSIIPANVRYDEGLKANEKLLYGEITALANKNGYCWAENKYFGDLYGVEKETVSRWVSNLEKQGYIRTELIRGAGKEIKERRIYIQGPLLTKKSIPYRQKNQYPIDENIKEELNNTSINNTSINKESMSSSDEHDSIPYEEIVEYLNLKIGSKYRSSTQATQRLIKARFNEGFDLEDFKQVIDNKASDWFNDKKMSEYLRPQTLFGTKFESYLNQITTNGGGGYDTSEYDDLF